jgi:hypothetical protein
MADLSFSLQFINVTFGDNDLTNDSAIRDTPLFDMVDIEEKGGGPVEEKFYLSGPRGFSGNLTDAQAMAQAAGSKHFRWQHPFGEHVGSIQVDVADVIQSRPDQAAADRALEAEFDKGMASEGQNLSDKLMGRGGLAMGFGEYEETAGTPTGFPSFSLRFADPSDARNFQVDDQIVISATDGTTDGDIVGEPAVVIARDVILGYVQVAPVDSSTAGNPGSWVDDTNYYVFKLGEYTDGDPDSIITSYERFLPSSAASDTLHNVDRSVDTILSGFRLPSNLETGSILQRSKRLITLMHARGGLKKADASKLLVVYNAEDWGTAAEELEDKVRREVGESTESGYEAFYVRTAVGKTAFVSDPGKNKGRAFILNTGLLKLYTASGRLFETIPDGSGSIIHLMPGRNTYEVRTISKVATGFGAPFAHASHDTDVS